MPRVAKVQTDKTQVELAADTLRYVATCKHCGTETVIDFATDALFCEIGWRTVEVSLREIH